MIIMALDHVRDLLHVTSLTQGPTDLNTTTPILFFTRWITYLCAPVFVFLSGSSAWLSVKKTNDYKRSGNFLLTRGIWLIILEFTLINFALWFDIHLRILMLQVIAAIGFGFILLSLLLRVNPKVLAAIALLIIAGYNLSQYLPKIENGFLNSLFAVLFQQKLFPISPNFVFLVAYPLIPWFGIMLLGFACGKIFTLDDATRKSGWLGMAIISLVLFTLLRVINGYGDPRPWDVGKTGIYTVLSFLNVTKYPPSLLFDLLFLGIMFLLLGLFDKVSGKFQQAISVYGKVPLFYYLLHLYMIRISVFIMVFVQGFHWKDLSFAPFQFGRPLAGSGISLGLVYLVWLIIVLLLFPLCKWYMHYKAKNYDKRWWLRYL